MSVCPYFKGCDADKLKRYRDAGADQVILVGFAPDRASLRATVEGLAGAMVETARTL